MVDLRSTSSKSSSVNPHHHRVVSSDLQKEWIFPLGNSQNCIKMYAEKFNEQMWIFFC